MRKNKNRIRVKLLFILFDYFKSMGYWINVYKFRLLFEGKETPNNSIFSIITYFNYIFFINRFNNILFDI